MGGTVIVRVTLKFGKSEFAGRVLRTLRAAAQAIFAERQILLRSSGRVRAFTLGWPVQAFVGVLLLAVGGWLAYATVARFESGHVIAAKEREIGALKLAYRTLESDVSRSENRFSALARTIEAKHAYLVTLMGRDTVPAAAVGAEVFAKETSSRAGLTRARQSLLAELGKLEMTMQGSALSEGRSARERLDTEQRLRMSTVDRARLDRQRRELVANLDKLEDRLAQLNLSQRGVAVRMAERAQDRVRKIKSLISSTGVNVEKLLARLGDGAAGLGGPFIPAAEGGASRAMPASLGTLDRHLERLDDLRKLASVLPLVAPSAHYYIASEFGKRRDPLNRRWAMHYGVDLAGVHRSPVLATAPGIVVRAGWNGNYGRMVEIDHGMGIRTRYGHLRRFVVKKGQRVELRQKIGEMGSSGRSTGTHLHYEVLVNGQPRNPVKFLQAGEYVLKGF